MILANIEEERVNLGRRELLSHTALSYSCQIGQVIFEGYEVQ